MEITKKSEIMGLKSGLWAILMASLIIICSPTEMDQSQGIGIFAAYFCLFWMLGYLFFAKAAAINQTRLLYPGLAGMPLAILFGNFMVDFFGLAGYIVSIVAICALLKFYLLFIK